MTETDRMGADETAVQFPRLLALLRYWDKKRGDRLMPARADIDPIEIPSLLPVVVLAGVAAGEVQIRLMGEEAIQGCGHEVRGRRVRDFALGSFTRHWAETFDLVLASAAPAGAAGFLVDGKRHCRIETILAPLSGAADPSAIGYIFGGLVIKPVQRDEAFVARAPKSYTLPHVLRGDDAAETPSTKVFRSVSCGRTG